MPIPPYISNEARYGVLRGADQPAREDFRLGRSGNTGSTGKAKLS
jgi:hypothetical protein